LVLVLIKVNTVATFCGLAHCTADEIDSYLYQTVGQDAIQLVADALEVPLIRRVITGEAVQQGSEYGSRLTLHDGGVQGDETEDLLELLSDIKVHCFFVVHISLVTLPLPRPNSPMFKEYPLVLYFPITNVSESSTCVSGSH
jgi:diphthamide synthase (EF-2-diphthine--ammonia ligase)